MIYRSGTVERLESGVAEITVAREATCTNCATGTGCAALALHRMLDRGSHCRLVLPAPSGAEFSSGDPVRIAVSEGLLLRGAVLAYLLPSAGLCAGAVVAALLAPAAADLAALAGGAAGLSLALSAVRRFDRGLRAGRGIELDRVGE